MNTATVLAALAAIASGFLFFRWRHYLPILALVISSVEILRNFKMITFMIKGFPVSIILGGALAVVGGFIITKVKAKNTIVAATAVTLIGAIQLITGLVH